LASSTQREYELVLMLDPEIPEERREQIASEARTRIESGGELKQDSSWGMRKLAYEIRQRTEADYRLFRFETKGELLDELDHNLRIADGVLRFRIFKVDPGAPAIVPPAPVAAAGSAPGRGPRRPPEGARAADQPEPDGAEEAPPEPEQAPEQPAGEAAGQPEPAPEPQASSEGDAEVSSEGDTEEPAPRPDQASEPEASE
jgi:small subunit ribosomal protein S6